MPRDRLRLTTSLFGQGISAAGQGSEGNPSLISGVKRLEHLGSLAVCFLWNCQTLNPLTGSCVRRKPSLSTEAPFMEPTCCVYLSGVQIKSSPFPTPKHTHLRPSCEADLAPASLSLVGFLCPSPLSKALIPKTC